MPKITNEDQSMLKVILHKDLKEDLRLLSKLQGTTVATVVRNLIAEAINAKRNDLTEMRKLINRHKTFGNLEDVQVEVSTRILDPLKENDTGDKLEHSR